MTTPLGWLFPPAPSVPSVVRFADVGVAGWHALLRDGVLHHVWGDLAIPADRRATATERADALRPLVPARAVVGRVAAAWVHTGVGPPTVIDLLIPAGRRRLAPHPHRRTHESELPEQDLVDVGGVRLTSVARTGIDLARWDLGRGAQAADALDALVALGFDPRTALRRLDRLGGQRGLRAARRYLETMVDGCRREPPGRVRRG
jgi:hypothetical protein